MIVYLPFGSLTCFFTIIIIKNGLFSLTLTLLISFKKLQLITLSVTSQSSYRFCNEFNKHLTSLSGMVNTSNIHFIKQYEALIYFIIISQVCIFETFLLCFGM